VTSYLLSYESRSRISYSSYVDTGETTEEFIMNLNYNENGELDGIVKPNNNTEVIINNGFIEGIIKYEEYNRSYVKDSIFLESKIWKQNGSYVKNQGLPIFQYNEFNNPTYVGYETINYDNFIEEEDTFVILDQNNQNLLDNYGVYSIRDRVNTKSFNNESKNKIEFFFEELLLPDNFRLVNELFINIINNKYLDYEIGFEVSLILEKKKQWNKNDDLINFWERSLEKLSPFYFTIFHSDFLKDGDVFNKYQSFIVHDKDYKYNGMTFINFEGIVSILNDYIKFPSYIIYKNFENKSLVVNKINLDLFEKELNRINNYKDLNKVHDIFLEELNKLKTTNQNEIEDYRNKLSKVWEDKVINVGSLFNKLIEISSTPEYSYDNIHNDYINLINHYSKEFFVEFTVTKKGEIKEINLGTDTFGDISSEFRIEKVLSNMKEKEITRGNTGFDFNYDKVRDLKRNYVRVLEKLKKLIPMYLHPKVILNDDGLITPIQNEVKLTYGKK
jgi:hypothetical protein